MRSSRVLVLSGLLLMVGLLFVACGGSSPAPPPAQALTITTTLPLAQGTVNLTYGDVLQAAGGTTPYTWSITSGALPPKLTLDPQMGLISGTPTTAGTFNFTVQVMDSAGHTATANLAIVIEGVLVVTCNSCIATNVLPYGSVGVPYPAATLSASGGVGPYSWCVVETNENGQPCDNGAGGALPAGLTITTSNGNGIISGTPTSQPAAPIQVEIQVSDSETPKATGTATLSLTIFSITTKTLQNGIINQPYQGAETQVIAGGGIGSGQHPYTWSVTSGSLPPGLSLCTTTAIPSCPITGTPTQLGTSNFTVTVVDGQTPPATATAMLSIDVQDPTLTITTASLPAGNVNLPYSAILQATGGNGHNTWSIASGSLPAGLTLNANTGAISGTPTTQCQPSQCPSFVVQVQDSENPPEMAMSGMLTINVGPAIGNSLLHGNFAIAFSGFDNGTPFILAASFVGDGTGNITSGVLDHNDGHGSEINDPSQCNNNPNCPIAEVMQSGSVYDLSGGNGLGTMTIMTLDANNNPHTYKFEISVSGNACTPGQPSLTACGRLIQRDANNPQSYGSGVLKIQNPAYFGIDAFFPGNFAVLLNGIDPSGNRYAAAGAIGTNLVTLIDVDCNGNGWHLTTGCPLNVNDDGHPASNPIAGSQFSGDIDPQTGRGAFVNLRFPSDPNGYCVGGMNGTNCGYAYYVIDKQEMILISGDPLSKPANLTLWTAYRQKSFATGWGLQQLDGPVVTELTGNDRGSADVTAGLFTADGAGNATFSGDENAGGTLGQPASRGTYALGMNGNTTGNFTFTFAQDPALNNAQVYLYTGGFGYFVGSDANVTSGVLEQQSGAPFSNISVIGTLEGATAWPAVNGVTNSVTELFADGAGDITGTQYTSGSGGPGGPNQLTLTYSVENTGRAVVKDQNGHEFGVLYVIGPNKFVLLPVGSNPALNIFISGQAD